MNAPLRVVRKSRSLALELVDVLQARILEGRFAPGSRMQSEAELMTEHGVSRTVVREALSRLQQAQLVVTQHGIGSFVADPLPNQSSGFRIDPVDVEKIVDVVNLLELRVSLESESAALAAKRRVQADLTALHAAVDSFDQSFDDPTATVQADFRFHLAIASATQNPHFFDLMRHLGSAVIPRSRVDSTALSNEDRQTYLERVNREHRMILDAIERQDTDSARAAMRLHLTNSRERLRRAAEFRATQQTPTRRDR